MVNRIRAFHTTCIGASHIKAGTVCQDYSLCAERGNYRLAVCCDGHGGADYFRSDRGSRFAAEAFCSGIDHPDFLTALCASEITKQAQNERITQLVKSVIAKWNSLIEQDIKNEPFTESEMLQVSDKAKKRYLSGEKVQSAYGTTLIGAVVTDLFWVGIQIGDGKCVAVSENGDFLQPIQWDDHCFLNITTSLCDENALSEFRFYFSTDIPVAIFLGSDGIDDCFAGDEKLYDFYRVVLRSFAETEDIAAIRELSEYLPELSRKGSGDDVSVAMLLNTEYIRSHKALYEKPKRIFLHITHDGNLGGDNPNDTYFQEADIEAVPGIYSLSEFDCGGFYNASKLSFEIVSVCRQSIVLRVDGNEYTVAAQTTVEITQEDEEASSDGPHFTAQDTLEFRMTEK